MGGIGNKNGKTTATERRAAFLLVKPNAATTKSVAAKKSIVVAVPTVGIKTRIGKNVPKTLPMVEIPKICPAESPTWPFRAMILMRNGLVMPMTTIGGEKRSVMAQRDPRNMNEKDELKFPTNDASHLTSGDATKGRARRKAEAAMRSLRRTCSRGLRSASLPPTK